MTSTVLLVAAPAAAMNGTITGHVTDAVSGEPIPGVRVSAFGGFFWVNLGDAITDADGAFSLLLPSGDFRLWLTDPSGDHTDVYSGGSATWSGSSVVQAAPGATVTHDRTMDPTSHVRGIVTTSSTSPKGRVRVEAIRDNRSIASTATTAADGSYDLTVGSGSYRLQFTDLDGVEPRSFSGPSPTFTGAALVDVTGGDTSHDHEIPMGGTVSGHATVGASGPGVSGLVAVLIEDSTNEATQFAVTSIDGRWQSPPLVPADYEVAVLDIALLGEHPGSAFRPVMVGGDDVLSVGLDAALANAPSFSVAAGIGTPTPTTALVGYDCDPATHMPGADLRSIYAPPASVVNLQGCNLSGADLSHTEVTGDLDYADLSGAALRCADLSGADLTGANTVGSDSSCPSFVVVGRTGAFVTDAAGITWASTANYFGTIRDLATDGKGTWVASGTSGQAVWHSSDGGHTWTAGTITTAFASDPESIATDGAGTWVAVGGNATWTSHDDGATWVRRPNSFNLNAVAYDGNGTWAAVGQVTAAYSTDGGVTWAGAPGIDKTASSLAADADGSFIAVGEYGATWSSTDGTSWTRGPFLEADFMRAIASDGAGTFVAVGNYGKLWRSSDHGGTWQRSTLSGVLIDVATDAAGTWFATVTTGQVYRSLDDGVSWTPIWSPDAYKSAIASDRLLP